MEIIRVLIVDMPPRIHGLTTYAYDHGGEIYYTILINAHDCAERQCATYDHEILHINRGDFEKMIPADNIESDLANTG